MTWTAVASLPEALNTPAAGSDGTKFYVWGQNAATTAVKGYVYDPGTNTWTAVANCPAGTPSSWQGGYVMALGGYLYLISAQGASWLFGAEFLRYDPTANTWTDLTTTSAMETTRIGVGGDVVGTKLAWVSQDGSGGPPAVQLYNPGTNSWATRGADNPTIDLGAGDVVATVGTDIYVIAGSSVSSGATGYVTKYDTVGGTWATRTANPTPVYDGANPTAGPLPGPIAYIGGYDSSGFAVDTVSLYDPTSDTWSAGPTLPSARAQSAGAVVGSDFYLAGGYDSTGAAMTDVIRIPAVFSGTSGGVPTNATMHVPFQWTFDVTNPRHVSPGMDLPFEWTFDVIGPVGASTLTTDDVDAWQVPFEWSFLVDLEPVEDPPPATDPYIQQTSEVMPFPTLVNGRPVNWEPTSVTRADWGRLQLIINGHDVSRPRGMRFQPLTVAYTEPFGDAEASFAFPGITEFDDPAAFYLTPLAPVTLRRKDKTGVFHTLYEGAVASLEPDQGDGNGVVVQCIGALYRLDLLKEPPRLLVQAQDYGDLITQAFNDKRARYNLNIGYMAAVKTGILGVRDADFKPFLSGTIQDYLAELTTSSGGQWTVVKAYPRTPKLMLKDTTTVHVNVSYGQRGVDVRLSKDFTTATTAVYGSGTNGHCTWMGARFPNLTQSTAPAFPLAVGHVFVAGDGQSGFAEFAAFLRRGGYGTIVSDNTYDSRDFDNVEQFQDRAGITVDGIVGAQTWEAAFQPGANQGSLSGAYVDTIWERPETRRRAYNAQGADVGANPAYNPNVPRIEDYVPFGDNVSKTLGTTSARQLVGRNYPAGRVGTITFGPGDPENMSRWDIRAGMNINVASYAGGTVTVHATRVVQDWTAGTVTCTVDEKARDELTAAAIYQRNKDVSDLTRRQRFGRTRSKVFNDYGVWLCEDGAGEIPLMNQQGGFWNVQRIAAGPKGTIARISLALGSGLTEHGLNQAIAHTINAVPGAARGAVLIFSAPVTPNSITRLPGMATPITDLGDGTAPVDHNQDALNRLGLVYAAGGPGQAIGFYPNNDPGDGSSLNLTGMFEDGAGVDYGPTGYYWLWLAIWTLTSCKVGGQLFPGAPS